MAVAMGIEDYYAMISDLMTFERFRKEIESRREKYGDLLDDEAIAYLIVDELGRNPGNRMKISEVYDGVNATLEVTVEKIGDVETVKGKHRILRVTVSDDTGRCTLVLWNEEIDKAMENLREGRKVKIINGYVKENMYGLQISLGKWGILVFD